MNPGASRGRSKETWARVVREEPRPRKAGRSSDEELGLRRF